MITPHQILERIDYFTESTTDQSPRDWLGASQIGEKCVRKLWYDFRRCNHERFDARMLRLFATGDRQEPVMVALLRGAGFEVETPNEGDKEAFRFKDCEGHFAGTCDGVAREILSPEDEEYADALGAENEWFLLEMKTWKSETKLQPSPGFETLVKQGVKSAAPKHYSQMQVYMGELKLSRALYCARNKNNDDLYFEWVEFDAQHFDECLNKAETVITATEPPQRYSDDRNSFTCKYCIHNSICHANKPVSESNRHCRNCTHGAPAAGGTWECRKGHTFGTICGDYQSV